MLKEYLHMLYFCRKTIYKFAMKSWILVNRICSNLRKILNFWIRKMSLRLRFNPILILLISIIIFFGGKYISQIGNLSETFPKCAFFNTIYLCSFFKFQSKTTSYFTVHYWWSRQFLGWNDSNDQNQILVQKWPRIYQCFCFHSCVLSK